LQELRKYGVAVLPFLVEAVRQRDVDMVRVISSVTGGEVKKDATREQVVSWWRQNKQQWVMPDEEVSTVGPGRQQ